MTYISAFQCQDGIVMSADTEESWGDYKHYTEKLSIIEDKSFPLAIGGAGIADLIEPMVQEVTERAAEHKPKSRKELCDLVRGAIETVYKSDLPWLAVKKQGHYRVRNSRKLRPFGAYVSRQPADATGGHAGHISRIVVQET